jgi:hypothetical protein
MKIFDAHNSSSEVYSEEMAKEVEEIRIRELYERMSRNNSTALSETLKCIMIIDTQIYHRKYIIEMMCLHSSWKGNVSRQNIYTSYEEH